MAVPVYASPLDRTSLLANGDKVDLHRAAMDFSLLSIYLGDDTDRHLVADLRRVCFGESLDDENMRRLKEQQLVDPSGQVDPTMRSVVLASVRGSGHGLFLDSPFTEPLDRALAEWLHAKGVIRAELTPEKGKTLLGTDLFEDALANYGQALRKSSDAAGNHPPGWSAKERSRKTDPGDTPPLG